MKNITDFIKRSAAELGFYDCGIAKADALPEDAARLESWLTSGRHGEMAYMENYFEKRTDPRKLMEGAKSVIVVLYNYSPGAEIPAANNYKISKYAYGTDYHHVMKKKLNLLIAKIKSVAGDIHARPFVDSAPVLERSWAAKAGLGWIGKNTCLITKKQGSYFFIGEIITDLELDYDDRTIHNYCGGCTRCIDGCPTDALDQNGLDARKCISYWTIEYRGDEFPNELQGKFNDYIFGCDICQDVCPWNRLSESHNEPAFEPSESLQSMRKPDWEVLSEIKFKTVFKNTAVKRAKFSGLKRNIEFVHKNSGEIGPASENRH